jgi:hypothetical protein
MSLRKVKYPVWLHADMEHLQNRIINYVYHQGSDPVDRTGIQAKWDKIKLEMDTALEEIDKLSTEYSVKGYDKVPITSVKGYDKLTVTAPKSR